MCTPAGAFPLTKGSHQFSSKSFVHLLLAKGANRIGRLENKMAETLYLSAESLGMHKLKAVKLVSK